MSLLFHNSTIRHKLSLVVVSASLLVLLFISLFFGAIEYVSSRQRAVVEIQTLAALLGDHLARPLMDEAPLTSERLLAALAIDHTFHAAYLFDKKFKPLAQYLDTDAIPFVESVLAHDLPGSIPLALQQTKGPISHFGLNHLSLYTPVFYQNTQIGSLFLVKDLSSLNQRLLGLLLAALLSSGVAVVFAWALSGRLHRPISEPILHLANTMLQISETSDYHLRGEKYAEDEIGQLVDGFNSMLSMIEARDLEIERHQGVLEHTVVERTAELTESIQRLEEARIQADHANQSKSAFLANITHELRTPLVGVLGMNELLIESKLDSQQRSLAKTVQRSGQELLELINEILDFSKIEGGHLKLNIERVNLLELVEDLIIILADRAYANGLELVCRVDPAASWLVEADPQRLRQVLINLLGNAIKFTQQGHVSLSLTNSVKGGFLFEVSDSGIGIDSESQAEIFEAFAQVDSSSSRVFGGTGLGLSIVREMVVLMKGEVTLESVMGEGSSFLVELPLKRLEPVLMPLTDDKAGRSVIIYEPRQLTRDAQFQMMIDLGFAVVGVATSEELLHRLKGADLHANCFDMVLLGEDVANEKFVSQVQSHCRIVICIQQKLVTELNKSGVIDILSPLLWSRFLQQDLYAESSHQALPSQSLEVGGTQLAAPVEKDLKSRILIVDDNLSTRELITYSLADTAWQADEASTAEEALSAVDTHQYLLILMDINMPGIDGLEATRRIRKRGIETPIFALTAHGDHKIFADCLSAGMQGHLRKPFRQAELFALLNQQPGSADCLFDGLLEANQ